MVRPSRVSDEATAPESTTARSVSPTPFLVATKPAELSI